MFPYEEYEKHYVIAFVYTRNPKAVEGKMYTIEQIHCLPIPYKDVEVFVQEKYKIAGDKPGSGNTENIGSYKTDNMEYLINGEGPFSVLGIPIFEQYWAGYPKYRSQKKDYTSSEEYFEWCEKMAKMLENSKESMDIGEDYMKISNKNVTIQNPPYSKMKSGCPAIAFLIAS